MELLFELFSDLPRQSPGDNASTRQALSYITDLPPEPFILDIGCGTGMQTKELARQTKGRVIGLDIHQPFLDELAESSSQEGLNIEVVNAPMEKLPFKKQSLDLMWSEGAIYLMGFEKGLQYWRDFLKPAGCMAVSELSWLTDKPHDEAKSYMQAVYPEIKTNADNLAIIAASGYRTLGSFVLPENSWWDNYYHPLLARIEQFRKKYTGNETAFAVADESALEIEMFRRYSDDYGYVFYIMQKSD